MKILQSILGDLPTFLEKTFLLSHNKSSKLKQIAVILYIFLLLFYGFASLHFSGLQKALEGPAFLNMIGVITSSHQIFMFFNQEKINNLLHIFQEFEKQHNDKWKKDIFKQESKMIWNLIHNYCMILMFYQTSYQILPLIADSLIGCVYPNFPSLRVPLFAQGFIDFTEPRTLMNFILSIPSVIWCGLEITGHIGAQALLLVSIAFIRVELKIIQQKLLIIKNILQKQERNYQNLSEELLKDVLIHHQKILRGLTMMNSTLGFPVAVENTMISICFCLNLYGIIALEGKESIAAKFEGISGMFSLLLVLFWSCSLGESLEDENNKIFQSVYDLPWFKEKRKTKNALIMMMRQINKRFVINYHLKAELNLRTFMQIINASYSYFMVLKSTTS